MAALHGASLLVPFLQQHLLPSCLSCFGNSPSISDLVIIVFVAGIHDQ